MKIKNVWLAGCLVLAMVMLTACSGGKTGEGTQTSNPAQETKPSAEGTAVTTKLWTLTYPDVWSYNEEDTSDDDNYSKGVFRLEEKDAVLVEAQIEVTKGSPDGYRDTLKGAGIDAYEMVENNAGDFVELGGVNCITARNPGGDRLTYLGRVENAEATVKVVVTGEHADPKVAQLLDTLKFTLEDVGNTDPPWPWNGAPIAPEASYTAMVANYKINSQWVPLEEPLVVDDTFSGEIAAKGDTLWVLLDNTLREYSIGEKLSLVWEKKLEDDYEKISVDQNGNLYVTGFMSPMLTLSGNEVVATNKDVDTAVMHPGGEWGVSFFYGSPSRKVTLNNHTATMSEWLPMDNVNVNNVSISEHYIFVAGTNKETDNHGVWVYDASGNEKCVLGNKEYGEPDSLGSITQVVETAGGFIGFDGNMREILFWQTDGTYIGSLEDSELFGTNYPWISAAAVMKDGSVLVGMTEERADKSADEFIVFRLTGF
ncbi:MAG: hypothetical protein PHY23_00850 [Oscillospiraceae bacterium]|nr:hypothetical protein [Oscillospiraceae bacterium]